MHALYIVEHEGTNGLVSHVNTKRHDVSQEQLQDSAPQQVEQPAIDTSEPVHVADDKQAAAGMEAAEAQQQPLATSQTVEADVAATPAPATAPATTPATATVTAPVTAPVTASENAPKEQQPASGGRGGRGRRGGRSTRGRGRSKARGKARAAGNASPKAPSEQDQAEFADQLESPSHNDEPADSASQPAQSDDPDVSISDTTDQHQASQQHRGSLKRRGRSDVSQVSDQLTNAKSRASKAAESRASAADKPLAAQDSELPPAAEETKESKVASKTDVKDADPQPVVREEEEKAASVDEPPAKRPRRSASTASQKAAGAESGKGKGRGKRPSGRRGVLKESESDDESMDVNIVGAKLVPAHDCCH